MNEHTTTLNYVGIFMGIWIPTLLSNESKSIHCVILIMTVTLVTQITKKKEIG